jgi:hypothetical protein
MKALKEKRVSLRSLFRRSLVILSLLALAFAFASCSSDSGSEPTEPTGPTAPIEPTEPPVTKDPQRTIISMTVLTHPRVPSFEGAAPDLSGLEVMVRFNNGDQARIKAGDARLTVHPPVAYVKEPGVSSWFSQYTLQYKDPDQVNDALVGFNNDYNDPVYGVNIWIPVVIALVDDTNEVTGGPIAKVYEDLGVRDTDALGLKFKGNYVKFAYGDEWGHAFTPGYTYASGAGVSGNPWPVDYYPVGKTSATETISDRWDALLGFTSGDWTDQGGDDAKEKALAKKNGWYQFKVVADAANLSNPISSDPRAWKIAHKADVTNKDGGEWDGISGSGLERDKLVQQTPSALYLANLNRPKDSVFVKETPVAIAKFFWVDRLNFELSDNVAEFKTIKPKAADDDAFGGKNVSWSVETKANQNRRHTWLEEVGEPTQVNWMWELFTAKLKFDVIYYDAGGTEIEKRQITMADYIRAMYTVDENGTPKATLPIFTGYPSNFDERDNNRTNKVNNPSSPQYWALNDGDYDLYMTLFYYSDLIMPARVKAGDPDFHLDPTGDYTTSVKGRGKVRPAAQALNGNGAQIPIATSDVHKVATFASIAAERKDSTVHNGEPTILGTSLNADDTRGFPSVTTTADRKTANYRTRMDLYGQLQKYWKGIWLYDSLDPDWPDQVKLPISRWYTFDGAEGGKTGWTPAESEDTGRGATKAFADKYNYEGFADYDLDEIEEVDTRTCEVLFPAPPSVGPDEDDTWEFEYFVKP